MRTDIVDGPAADHRDLHVSPSLRFVAFVRLNNLAQRYEGGCEYPEVIITNYNPKERENASFQMNLFDCGYGLDEDEPQYGLGTNT